MVFYIFLRILANVSVVHWYFSSMVQFTVHGTVVPPYSYKILQMTLSKL